MPYLIRFFYLDLVNIFCFDLPFTQHSGNDNCVCLVEKLWLYNYD